MKDSEFYYLFPPPNYIKILRLYMFNLAFYSIRFIFLLKKKKVRKVLEVHE